MEGLEELPAIKQESLSPKAFKKAYTQLFDKPKIAEGVAPAVRSQKDIFERHK